MLPGNVVILCRGNDVVSELLNIFLRGLGFQLRPDARQELLARLVVNPVHAQKWSTLNRWINNDDRPALMRVEGVRYFLLFLLDLACFKSKFQRAPFAQDCKHTGVLGRASIQLQYNVPKLAASQRQSAGRLPTHFC